MIRYLAILMLAGCSAQQAPAHDPDTGRASAILNEGVMVEAGDSKLLFDPLFEARFHPGMTEELAASIAAGSAPYDDVDAVFISHFHPDHFSATHVIALLEAQRDVRLFAPAQAVALLREDDRWSDAFEARTQSIELELEGVETFAVGNTEIEVIRVPHFGYPARHEHVENLIFRARLAPGQQVMHLGDAASDDQYYAPHAEFFAASRTGLAFVPYWFLIDPDGRQVVEQRLNAEQAVGIHVGTSVPPELEASGEDYFATLGESRAIPHTHDH